MKKDNSLNQPPPFECKSRTLITENLVFDVFYDHIKDQRGNEVPRFLVVKPKVQTSNKVTGVAILPEIGGKIAMIQVYRHPVGEWLWEIPRGFVDEGEKNETSVIRELEEETGFLCEEKNIIPLGYLVPDGGIFCARIRLYVARDCKVARPYVAEEMGHGEMRLFDRLEIRRMANDSEIQDPSTLTAIYRYLDL
ncbi:MAG: hypothetical protein COV66_05265 [Nitrospinae bacterium CG11_big_fil_rev_8_21_14_0_20_45_15]|nr:MAG: hypothetical protein COV66_05265 [Nitrospinae bacterium CG11_big_fil_rev_8_21_14_0_20_45_15]